MRRVLTILLVLDVIAAIALIFRVESLIESVEVTADNLPQFLKEFAKTDSEAFQRVVDHEVSYIERTRDYSQHVRVVVQLVGLLLVVNAGFFWYVRRRWPARLASPLICHSNDDDIDT